MRKSKYITYHYQILVKECADGFYFFVPQYRKQLTVMSYRFYSPWYNLAVKGLASLKAAKESIKEFAGVKDSKVIAYIPVEVKSSNDETTL